MLSLSAEGVWEGFGHISEAPRDSVAAAFDEFVGTLSDIPPQCRQQKVKALTEKAVKNDDDFAVFAEIAENRLYRPDSSSDTEDIFILFLKEFVELPCISEETKIRPAYQLERAQKNRPGHAAADFGFALRDGSESSLYEVINDCATTIFLVFYDPDCEHCRELMDELSAKKMPDSLKVLAIYSGDEADLWKETAAALPSEWLVGYDGGTIVDEDIYAIRYTPAIYVIDKDKIVVNKDLHSLPF